MVPLAGTSVAERHEQQSVAMAVTAALHHSSDRKKLMEMAMEQQNEAPRRETTVTTHQYCAPRGQKKGDAEFFVGSESGESKKMRDVDEDSSHQTFHQSASLSTLPCCRSVLKSTNVDSCAAAATDTSMVEATATGTLAAAGLLQLAPLRVVRVARGLQVARQPHSRSQQEAGRQL